jgi:maltooligosyltrehalose trehalohydrolase
MHIGTYTPEGTLDAAAAKLDHLVELGVEFVELLPVNAVNGEWNWGYDGVGWFAVHAPYGGPDAYDRFVDRAHALGLGVIQDVVHNHLGPSGNYLPLYGPYLLQGLGNTWGDSVNVEHPEVRRYVLDNVRMWFRDHHVDGLRLDAVHAIFDNSPQHICAELADRVRQMSDRALVTSEMSVDDYRPIDEWGHDAQWADRSHHELHVLLTGEREGYYAKYGSVRSLAEDLQGRGRDPRRLIVCAQNHDQVGNRAIGDRLPPDALRVAAALTLFSPCTPLLFMGEEYLEEHPFQFFTDHIDPEIAEATREGRKREFQAFSSFSGEEVPDPQDVETFLRSKLTRQDPDPLYRELLELRRDLPRELEIVEVDEAKKRLRLRRGAVELVVDLGTREVEVRR